MDASAAVVILFLLVGVGRGVVASGGLSCRCCGRSLITLLLLVALVGDCLVLLRIDLFVDGSATCLLVYFVVISS